jgi:hypothetical protein
VLLVYHGDADAVFVVPHKQGGHGVLLCMMPSMSFRPAKASLA